MILGCLRPACILSPPSVVYYSLWGRAWAGLLVLSESSLFTLSVCATAHHYRMDSPRTNIFILRRTSINRGENTTANRTSRSIRRPLQPRTGQRAELRFPDNQSLGFLCIPSASNISRVKTRRVDIEWWLEGTSPRGKKYGENGTLSIIMLYKYP